MVWFNCITAFSTILERPSERLPRVQITPNRCSGFCSSLHHDAEEGMPTTELKDVIPILDVRDVETALRFYVERLGFQLDFRYEEDPNNYAGVRRGGVCLHMQ